MATLKPNTSYHKVIVEVYAGESVLVSYPGYKGFYYLEEGLKVPEFYLTDNQYSMRFDRCREDHLKAVLRRHIEVEELGREKAELDENGEIIEETWEWIPGSIDPKDFFMGSLPMMKTKVIDVKTDDLGNIIETEE